MVDSRFRMHSGWLPGGAEQGDSGTPPSRDISARPLEPACWRGPCTLLQDTRLQGATALWQSVCGSAWAWRL